MAATLVVVVQVDTGPALLPARVIVALVNIDLAVPAAVAGASAVAGVPAHLQ